MRLIVVGLILVLGLAQIPACAPSMHRETDDWDRETILEPDITGDNDKDEARWRRELASDPFGDDGSLLTDDPAKSASESLDDQENAPPPNFVGPPEPPSTMDSMRKRGNVFGRALFSVLTVVVTLGMMAAPYLLMI